MDQSSKPGAPKGPPMRPIASFDTAYRMVGPVILGMFFGYSIDQYFKTQPWWMLGMIFFGLITGFWSVLRPLYFPSPDTGGEASDDKDLTSPP